MFAVLTTGQFALLPASGVIEGLERSAVAQAKGNLAAGPFFRGIADDFRQWAKQAEPGWLFVCPEALISVVRLATNSPLFTALSREAREAAERVAPEPDNPRITLP